MCDVLISIVTYNNATIIKDTIKSILKNTVGINYKIVIHDNNSSDNTIDMIQSFNDDRIKIIDSKVNNGFGYGHNQILQKYDADYYIIYNPDLRLKNNIIKELYDYMQQHNEAGMITPKITYPDGKVQYLCKENPTVFDLFFRRFMPTCIKKFFLNRSDKYEMRQTGYDKIFQIPYATGCFMFFRGDVLKKINGFDDNIFMYLEDADITRRANAVAQCVFYPYNSVEHLWCKGSHKSLYLTWINIKSAIYYFNKWGWKFW